MGEFIFSSRAAWFWVTLTLAVATVIVVFTVGEDTCPMAYVRYVLGSVFILWLPGYTFMTALFPRLSSIKTAQKSLHIVERMAVSLGMSLALVPIAGLLLNYTPWGIRLVPITLSLLMLTLICLIVALAGEHQIYAKARFMERCSESAR